MRTVELDQHKVEVVVTPCGAAAAARLRKTFWEDEPRKFLTDLSLVAILIRIITGEANHEVCYRCGGQN